MGGPSIIRESGGQSMNNKRLIGTCSVYYRSEIGMPPLSKWWAEYVFRDGDRGAQLAGTWIPLLLYADDIVLIADSPHGL